MMHLLVKKKKSIAQQEAIDLGNGVLYCFINPKGIGYLLIIGRTHRLPQLVAVYHQNEVLYIIIAKEYTAYG